MARRTCDREGCEGLLGESTRLSGSRCPGRAFEGAGPSQVRSGGIQAQRSGLEDSGLIQVRSQRWEGGVSVRGVGEGPRRGEAHAVWGAWSAEGSCTGLKRSELHSQLGF